MVDSGVLGVCVWHARDALLLKTDAPRHAGLSPESSVLFLSSQGRVDRRRRAAPLHSVSVASDQRADRDSLISTHRCGILTERPLRLAFGVFWGRDAPSVADLLYHDEGTTSSVLRTVRTSDIVPRLARPAASWRRRRASLPPLFGWGCSSYRRTWGCVKCGAASAASWRSRVAARHCYYGPPVSICCEF